MAVYHKTEFGSVFFFSSTHRYPQCRRLPSSPSLAAGVVGDPANLGTRSYTPAQLLVLLDFIDIVHAIYCNARAEVNTCMHNTGNTVM